MVTTIQISEKLQRELAKKKLYDRETYEEVLWDLLEDTLELSEQTKQELQESRAEIKAGSYKSLSKVKKDLGL